jgi:hypothetical protein
MLKRMPVLASMALVLPAIAADPQVPYPAGYRNWHHVKSMVIDKGHPLYEAFGGIHHLYANPKAVAGYKSGKFPDGATIVFDLLGSEIGRQCRHRGRAQGRRRDAQGREEVCGDRRLGLRGLRRRRQNQPRRA